MVLPLSKKNQLMASTFEQREQLEQQIAGLLGRADRQAIDLIYENYAPTLLGLISRIIPDPVVAEEALQDTFVKIWKNALQYQSSKGRLFTWFANIARNTAIDTVRSARFRRRQQTTSTENFVNKDELGNEEMYLRDIGLQKVLANMDPKYRELIELAYFKSYSQREIVQELDIPLGTVKTRLRKAIEILRAQLKGDFAASLAVIISVLTKILNDWN